MAEFTLTDKSLMLRAARILETDASVLEASHGPVWSATAEGPAAKREHDRLLRDARDLRTLCKRFEALHPPVRVPDESPDSIDRTERDGVDSSSAGEG